MSAINEDRRREITGADGDERRESTYVMVHIRHVNDLITFMESHGYVMQPISKPREKLHMRHPHYVASLLLMELPEYRLHYGAFGSGLKLVKQFLQGRM